jgi:Arf-GAP/coiled-coil/ANK repeat/PH domain-containing protein
VQHAERAADVRDRSLKLRLAANKYREALHTVSDAQRHFSGALASFASAEGDAVRDCRAASQTRVRSPPARAHIPQGAVGTLADALRRLSTSFDALNNELDTQFVQPLASLDAPLEDLRGLRRAYDRRLALYDQARARCLQVASDARPAAVAAAEGELSQKKADFDASVAALAAGLQAAHTARRCTPGEAACGVMTAHAKCMAAGDRVCAPLTHQAEQLKAALTAERVAGAQHVASPSKPPLAGPRHRRTLSAGRGIEEGGEPSGPDDGGPSSQRSMAGDILKQGYLLKLSSSLYGDWKRRYFVVTAGGELHYFRDAQASKGVLDRLKAARPGLGGNGGGGGASGTGAAGPPPVTLSLLTTMVKASAEAPLHTLRFCFRVVSPARTLTLQAENAKEQKEWMEAISDAIAVALSTHSPGEGPRTLSPPPSLRAMQTHRRTPSGGPGSSSSCSIVEELYRCEGNAACADCGAEWPEWASLNLTVLLCLRCSGVHRSLGVHVSKVRSLTLDVRAWDGPMLQCFAAGGNAHVNAVLEAKPGASAARPGPGAPHEAVREFACLKYVERRWVPPHLKDTAGVQGQLAAAVASGDVSAALTALLAGACADEMFSHGVEEGDSPLAADGPPLRRVSTKLGRTLLHVAASAGQVALCELLLHWRAAVDATDGDGRTPLYLACRAAASDTARAAGGAAVAVRLLRRGADPGRADRKGRSPAQLAAPCRDEALQAALAQAATARHESLPGGLARTHSSA